MVCTSTERLRDFQVDAYRLQRVYLGEPKSPSGLLAGPQTQLLSLLSKRNDAFRFGAGEGLVICSVFGFCYESLHA